ncbi:succinylglutamate desuccinylase/aspartoacylase family protein, partial [Myxococcota bacterium]
VWNVLKYLEMWPGKATLPSEKSLVMLEKYVPVKSPITGIFYPSVKPGQKVSKGDPIGVLTDFFDKETMRIKSPASGIICSLMMHPPAAKDEGLADICTFPKKK